MKITAALLLLASVLGLCGCPGQTPTPVPPTPVPHFVSLDWQLPPTPASSPRVLPENSPTQIAHISVVFERDSAVLGFTVERAACSAFVAGASANIGTCSAEGNFTQIAETDTMEFVDGSVVPAQSYSYYVMANYTDGTTSVSNHVAALVPADSIKKSRGAFPAGKALP